MGGETVTQAGSESSAVGDLGWRRRGSLLAPARHSASCPRGNSSSACFSRRLRASLASGEGQVAPCRVALGSQEPPLWRVDPASGPAAASLHGAGAVSPRPPELAEEPLVGEEEVATADQ